MVRALVVVVLMMMVVMAMVVMVMVVMVMVVMVVIVVMVLMLVIIFANMHQKQQLHLTLQQHMWHRSLCFKDQHKYLCSL